MTTEQLLWRLQKAIKENPKVARLPVKLSQYDDAESNNTGESSAERIDIKHDRIVIE